MIKSLKNGQYEYNEKDFVGEGAFAKVYKGKIVKDNKTIAVRIMSLSLLKKYGSKIKEIINGQVAVLRELATASDPERVFTTKIYDCFLTENNVTMILEFCPDGNLEEVISKRGGLHETQAAELIYQIGKGIQFIAKRNVVHRDIKPDNIFIKKEGNFMLYKLGDFGFAVKKQINDEIVGTPIFMSPEIFRQEKYGTEVDVWAFGLLAHYILFKEFYFIANTEKEIKKRVLNENYEPKSYHKSAISSDMVDFLKGCLAMDKRYRTKATQLTRHRVFDKVRPKVQAIMQEAMKNSNIAQSNLKKDSPKGSMINYLTSFSFITHLANNLTGWNQYNLASLYLLKYNMAEVEQVRKKLQKKENLLGLNGWKEFCKSTDFDQVVALCNRIGQVSSSSFNSLHQNLMKTISQRYSPQVANGIQANLGSGPYEKIKPEIIVYELTNNLMPQLKKQNNPDTYCWNLECMIAMKLVKGGVANLDFTYLQMNRKNINMQQRCELYESSLKY